MRLHKIILLLGILVVVVVLQMQTGIASGSISVEDADAVRNFTLNTASGDALDSTDASQQETFIDVFVNDADAIRDFDFAPADPLTYSVGEGAPDPATKNHFIDAYNRNGGTTVLGSPTTEVHRAWGYLVQDFPGATGYVGGIIMYNPYKNYAYYIHGAIWERYYGLGGPRATTDIEFELGPPVSDIEPYIHTLPPEVSSHGTQFRYQNFEGGALDHNVDTGEVFEVHGAICAKWCELGYASGELGLVTSDEREAAQSPIGTTGRVSDFEGGHIHWHGSGDHYIITYVTHGDLDDLYTSMGGTASWLGFPVKDQEEVDGHGYCEFEGGYIGWDAIAGVYKAFEKTSIKSKLFIEDASSNIVVNKAPGDIADVVVEIENTGDTTQNVKVELDYPLLGAPPIIYSRGDYFDEKTQQPAEYPLDIEMGPQSKMQIIWRFELPSYMIPADVTVSEETFVSDKLVSTGKGTIKVVRRSDGIIITNRKLLYEKFGKNAETTSLLNTLYDISDGDNNKKEIYNVVYYVDRYSSLAADWDQKITYPLIPSESINEVAHDIDLIVESKHGILQSDYLTIIGGDEIIPFYRLHNPDRLKREKDTNSNDPVLEIVNHNHIPTDNIYSGFNGESLDLDDWIIPELSIGRISSATAKDMQTFIKNSLKGPSDNNNNNAILATDSSNYNVGIIEKVFSDKQLDFEPPISYGDSSEVALQLRNEMNKHEGYKILSYAGHSSVSTI
ncbi:MAG: hypothetical protein AEth_01871 [Candidatus Argoarchaeum ethanivorans]|uniref:Gingipain domain-containing protein n=1 Tax=Candidatus Argoarchaeum ethanivorans TaxID=2608793 RepID=A0A8B3S0G0_9EURY|nr:MAG: hypothetical protein AEth_01871 [Candidatus Argoarchaeum ethanivorans]